jgi:hypothetical protein
MKIENIIGFSELSPQTKKWIKRYPVNWAGLEEHHLRFCIMGGGLFDKFLEAKSQVDTEGLIIYDRFDQPKPHPLIDAMNKLAVNCIKCFRECGFDLSLPGESRPPSGPGGYN